MMECSAYGAITFAVGFLLGGAVMFGILRAMYSVLLKLPTTNVTVSELTYMFERDKQIRTMVEDVRYNLDKLRQHGSH